MNAESSNATNHVAEWVASHRNQIGGTQLKFARQEKYGPTFCAEFETSKYHLQFLAWDQGCCVDLLALNKDTGCDDYIVAGECDGRAGVSARLEAFLHWLKVNEPDRAA